MELKTTAFRVANDAVWADLDAKNRASAELALAASDYARVTMIERFPVTDVAVQRAYERLRTAIDAMHSLWSA